MRAFVVTISIVLAAGLEAAPRAPLYQSSAALAGPDGTGWDYASVDPVSHRLYVAHGETATVFDLARASAARSIGSISHAHAVVPLPNNRLLVTSGKDASVRLIDVGAGSEVAKIAVGADPDAAIPDPATGHVLVMNAEDGSVSEVDVAKASVVRTIAVKPALEYAAIGRNRTLFINNEDAGEIDTVDLRAGKATGAIAMPGCAAPSGLAYDAAHDTLIAACANGKAAIVDAGGRKLVKLIAIGQGPDAVILDAKRRRAFIPCGRDGVLEVRSLDARGGIQRIATVKTEPGALDPATGAIYLPTARFGPLVPPAKRPPALPGTFHVVVVRQR